jgi:hypothetical protein
MSGHHKSSLNPQSFQLMLELQQIHTRRGWAKMSEGERLRIIHPSNIVRW